ncbi:MAG: MG2 domain-containing protein [Cytophagales bacterium]|nr:MG2 domain-containing protein [Cytophagales bacterium]
MKFNHSFFGIYLLAFLLTFSCREGEKKEKDTFSSPKTLFAEYVSVHTAGYVSKKSEITVKLTKPVQTAEPGKEIGEKLFSFEPALKGKTVWEDHRTIVFKPATELANGQRYKTVFLIDKLVEVPTDRSRFKFTFECIPQSFHIKFDGISVYDANDLKRVKLTGKIQTADQITREQAGQLLRAEQAGKAMKITYEYGLGRNLYGFVIENIARGENEHNVTVSWNGDAIGADMSGKKEYAIPALDEFKVTSVNIIQTGDKYISVKFSDPIDPRQNLRGLVTMSMGTAPRVVTNLNELKVYATGKLAGKVTLTVDRSIKNTAGYALKDDFETDLQFSQNKPEVKITANKGVIMPSSEGLIVPFEAVSLSAVDLTIIRIFENNVLQYLQVNDPGGSYQLQRVGRPIVRKTIPLAMMGATNLSEWNRFSIDLAEYVDVEPGAFYQVRLDFRKSHSLYFCSAEQDGMEETFPEQDREEELDWSGYDDDYYYYYDWEQRDNPCHESYYARRRGNARKIIFASDIGILAKKAEKGNLHVFTTNLISALPMQGAQIDVYDYQQQLITSGITDGDGKLEIEVKRKPYALIAKKNSQFGYLKLDEESSLSLSNFNVSGHTVQKGIKGFIYGERGVWRPSDTLHLSFLLEDAQNRLPEAQPVILELFNPLGQLHSRSVQSGASKGLYTFHLQTPEDALTGNWLAKVKVGGAAFTKQVKIETVKPNRLKVELKFDEDKLYADQGTQYGNLKVRWLHGAVAKNLKASYEVLLVPTKTSFKGYEDVTFDDPSKEFRPENEPVFEGRLDEQGIARIPFRLQTTDEAPGMMKAVFKGKVFEEGGDFSIDNTAIQYVPYNSFAGIKVPEGNRWGALPRDKSHHVRIVSLDSRGNPVDRKLEVGLYRMQWRWWWDNSWENRSNYTSSYYSDHIKTTEVRTENGEGTYVLNVERWGRYLIRVKDPVSGHAAGKIVYMSWTGNDKIGALGGVTMLDFNVERESLKVGEFVRLNIPSSEGGRALISLETGSRVLQTFWVDTETENTTVEFEATPDMAPNVYAHVTMLQPHAQTGNDLPIRMYGVQSVEVADPETQLKPVISMPDELRSEQSFSLEVSEAHKRPMTYTIAIVEDGLLDLTKFQTPEPWKSFYAREALGIKTWDIFDDVMGAYGGELEKLMAVGGDDEVGAPEADKANRFKPVVLFKGPFHVKAGERKAHKFQLPQYIGSVRAMVVAGYDGAYGSSEKTVPVKQPLMILATLPRVAGPSEQIALPVNVFAMDEHIRDVKLSVETSGRLEIAGASSKTITFSEPGDRMAYFDLKATPALGLGKVRMKAISGSFEANYDVELQVRASNPEMSQVEEKVLAGGNTWDLKYNPLGLIGTNEGMIEISSLPPLNLEQRMKYLIRYPHGCIEQTTSSVFAQLYLDELVDVDEKRSGEIQRNINAAIERLRSFQLADGGFSYWPGNSQPNLWGTNYAGHFLVEAKKQGYHVPEDIMSKWVAYQQEQANNWNAILYRDNHTQAYRLYTLAISGSPSLGAMNRLKGRADISPVSKWMLASAYAIAGYEDAALGIIEGLTTDVKEYRELGGTYGSTQRDQAMILETLTRLNRPTDAFEMIKKIADKMGNTNHWMSTQTTAYCLIGIAEFAKNVPPGDGVNVGVNIAGNAFRVDGDRYLNQVTLIEPDDKSEIRVENNGDNPLFIRLIRTGVPLEGTEEVSEANIKMEVAYKDMQGSRIHIDELKQGTDFIAEVTITNPGLRGDYEELAITQIFPSGWEILNNRLDDTDQYQEGYKPEYLDIRDDRVLTYFDLSKNTKATFRVFLNASYRGEYYMPAVSVEAMYDNSIASNTKGKWVKVVK